MADMNTRLFAKLLLHDMDQFFNFSNVSTSILRGM